MECVVLHNNAKMYKATGDGSHHIIVEIPDTSKETNKADEQQPDIIELSPMRYVVITN